MDELTPAGDPSDAGGLRRPRLLIFDVNETLSDLSPLSSRFADLGLPGDIRTTWFSELLRDGFALAVAGSSAPFAELAAETLRVLFTRHRPNREVDDAVTHILDGFGAVTVHDDVVPGLQALAELDLRMATLSNGSASVAESLLGAAGVREHFERLLSVEDAGRWKPDARSYRYALEQCQVDARDAMLVAVHPWDTDGAARSGLSSAWINRHRHTDRYPSYFIAPTVEAGSLVDLADRIRSVT